MSSSGCIKPRIIIHGGAGNITHKTVPEPKLKLYRASLLRILKESHALLQKPGAKALDVAVHAVTLLEDDPLFNCGKGAVFTRDGINELEASVMVSNGYRKRGVGCTLLRHVKNPINLAAEMLKRGEHENGDGAYGHLYLSGEKLEELARNWGLELVDPSYFFTQERWDQHKRGLEKEIVLVKSAQELDQQPVIGDATWDVNEYVPQGTVGAVVLDDTGAVAVATSTGGLTNKMTGRVGDTPTIGAGFWAGDWEVGRDMTTTPHMSRELSHSMNGLVTRYGIERQLKHPKSSSGTRHAVAISGTGNGDSFLKLSAARSAAALAHYTPMPLSKAIKQVAGPGGELQQSAGDRFGVTGDGEAGMIGIELVRDRGRISFNFNRGMFRAYIDDNGQAIFGAFRESTN